MYKFGIKVDVGYRFGNYILFVIFPDAKGNIFELKNAYSQKLIATNSEKYFQVESEYKLFTNKLRIHGKTDGKYISSSFIFSMSDHFKEEPSYCCDADLLLTETFFCGHKFHKECANYYYIKCPLCDYLSI